MSDCLPTNGRCARYPQIGGVTEPVCRRCRETGGASMLVKVEAYAKEFPVNLTTSFNSLANKEKRDAALHLKVKRDNLRKTLKTKSTSQGSSMNSNETSELVEEISYCFFRGALKEQTKRHICGQGDLLVSIFDCSHPNSKDKLCASHQCGGCKLPQPRQLVIQHGLSPGDVLMLTAFIRDLHLTYPGKYITDIRTPYPAIWENCPYDTKLPGFKQQFLDEACRNRKPLEKDGITYLPMHYELINECGRPYHFIHGFFQWWEKQMQVPLKPIHFRPEVWLTEKEKKERPFKDPYWVVDAGGKFDIQAKWWPPSYYQEVVDRMKGKVTFVQVGGLDHFHPRLEGAVDWVGKTVNMRHLVLLIYHSEGVLTPVSFPMHLAAAMSKPCVVVAGSREPSHWEAYTSHAFLHTCGTMSCRKDGGGCWVGNNCSNVVEFDNPDLVNFPQPKLKVAKCLEMIKPEEVVRAISRYFEGGMIQRSATVVREYKEKKIAEQLEPGKRYLLLFEHGLGDAIMFVPLVNELRRLYPKSVIHYSLGGKRGQEILFPEAVEWRPDLYDKAFKIGFPMEGEGRTKQEQCCHYELGIPFVDARPSFALTESPIVLVHFQSTSCSWMNLPEGTAKTIWDEVGQAGKIPYEVQFYHYWNAPTKDKYWNFLTTTARNASKEASNAQNLLGLMQRAYAFIGVVSGPLNLALAVCPERTLALNTQLGVEGITRAKVARIDALRYRPGIVRQWLTEIRKEEGKK